MSQGVEKQAKKHNVHDKWLWLQPQMETEIAVKAASPQNKVPILAQESQSYMRYIAADAQNVVGSKHKPNCASQSPRLRTALKTATADIS
jgi:hypothetical protein